MCMHPYLCVEDDNLWESFLVFHPFGMWVWDMDMGHLWAILLAQHRQKEKILLNVCECFWHCILLSVQISYGRSLQTHLCFVILGLSPLSIFLTWQQPSLCNCKGVKRAVPWPNCVQTALNEGSCEVQFNVYFLHFQGPEALPSHLLIVYYVPSGNNVKTLNHRCGFYFLIGPWQI